ncbi:MAG: ATP-binding cassette domain-containing protein [Alphaproteobacteria bacterium]|nr:ATP-binding cassette domain-containing protein [Alphaproteobacteria bacterium]
MDLNILQSNKTQNLVKRLVRGYLANYFGQLAIAVFFMAFAGAMTALIAALMQPILDDVLAGGKEELIIPVSIGIALTFTARGITTYVHTLMMNRIGHSIVADIQKQLFSHFMELDLAFFHKNPSGTLLSRVVNDVNVMRTSVTSSMTGFGKSLFTLIFLIGLMFYRDWKLTLAAFVVFPILSMFVIYIGKRLRKISKSIQTEMGDLSDLLSQAFQGIRVVKAYNMENFETKKVSKGIAKVRDLNIKAVRVSMLSTPVNEMIVGIIFAAIIVYGGYEVLAGRTTAGHLASFIAAFTLAYEPMKKLARLNNTLQLGLGATERIFEMMDLRPSIYDQEEKKSINLEKANVTFENVSFAYEETKDAAITDISFTAETGKVTALVGPSGGGKSTIMNLIPRFYDVQSGAIKINAINIKDISLCDLRSSIALVSQDITIFNDTVFQNIKYGNMAASDTDIINAAKAAAAHEFIEQLENGYDTIVGENGTKLSGGQKQRISIARAILRDAPILLLDEATSALDNESEKLVQEALRKLEEGRTTIVIAHRLSTVQSADNIIVLDKGKIREQGTHKELIKLNDLYARMHKTGLSEQEHAA